MPELSRLGRSALWWARHGWYVFPLVQGGKVPLIAKQDGGHGYLDATRDEAKIRQWWTNCPNANIGGACGLSGKSVLDVDEKKGGLDQLNALMLEVGAEQFATWRHGTPGNGFHYVFAAGHTPIKNSEGLIALGIDTRGHDGYIVLPPSRINGRRYAIQARERDTPLLPFPIALRERLAQNGDRGDRKHISGVDDDKRILFGQRHAAMKSFAARLRYAGLDQPKIFAALCILSDIQCDPPHTDEERQEELRPLAVWAGELATGREALRAADETEDRAKWGTLTDPVIPKFAELKWPKPAPLSKLRPSVESLPIDMIPLPFRAFVVDVAERMNVPLEIVASPLIIAAGSLIGRALGMRPKQYDNWTEYANLWGGIIGRPAFKKSPALREALKPFRHVERRLHAAFVEAETERAPKRHVIELQITRIERQIKTAKTITSKGDLPPDDLVERLHAQQANRNELIAPEPRRSVTDVSPEKLADLHADNPRGILQINDELVAMLREFDKVGREGSRAFYLAAWAGNVTYPIDRIGRGSTSIPGLCLAIIGTATPGAMRAYIREAQGTEAGADGLLQRFQFLIWVDRLLPFRHVDRAPDADASNRVREIFMQIEMLDPQSFAAWSDGDGDPPFVRFDQDGQRLFDQWEEQHDGIVRACSDMPALESHLAKYPKLFAGLALIFHVTSGLAARALTNRVGAEAAALAAKWCDYLELHARRAYAEGALTPAETFADHILRGDVTEGMSLRDVYRHGWLGLGSAETVHRAADALVKAGWIRLHQGAVSADGGQPPSPQILLNPAIAKGEVPQ
jgi:Protein of unknown function (DUF3987)/Bifunctional DNA primase/polymerase, N-terminal